MTLAVRPAAIGDVEAVATIEAEAFGGDAWTPPMIEGSLGDNDCGRSFVAAEAGSAVGWVGLRLVAGEAELLRIATRPASRRRGVARRLLVHALRACGDPRCHLEARAGNHPALALYRALGFAPSGRRRRYFNDGAEALLMVRAAGCSDSRPGVC